MAIRRPTMPNEAHPPRSSGRPRRKARGSASAAAAATAFALASMVLACLVADGRTAPSIHHGGVGACAFCHIMHESADGQVVLDVGRPLLRAATATDLCLMCHGTSGVFGSDPLNPPRELGAGNFVWLLENNLNDAPDGALAPIPGAAAGHSIVSPLMGTGPENRWTRAPGGSFPSNQLGCTSCHDPHGSGGFRMLHGIGPVQAGAADFIYPAPTAIGLDITAPAAQESRSQHTAYRSGMSLWCANCHGPYHEQTGTSGFEHPVDETIDSSERQRYNRYEGDADPTGGTEATAYLPEVAFEGPGAAVNSTAGPASTDRIHCLTCHRAHASSAPASGRWDFRVAQLAQDGVVSGSYALPNPYPGALQGQLCRKCHSQNHDRGTACITCHGNGSSSLVPINP